MDDNVVETVEEVEEVEEVDCAIVLSEVKLSDVVEGGLNGVLNEEDVEADCEVVVSVVEPSEVVDVMALVGELSFVVVSEVVSYDVNDWDVDESDVVRSELVVCVIPEVGASDAVVSE